MNKIIKKSFAVFSLYLLSSSVDFCKANFENQIVENSNISSISNVELSDKVLETKLSNSNIEKSSEILNNITSNDNNVTSEQKNSDLNKEPNSQDFDLNDSNYIIPEGELVTFDKELVSKELEKDYVGTGRIYIWDYLRDKYIGDKSVNELVFVKYKESSYADIELYAKNEGGWECVLKCDGYVGPKGVAPANINCARTPEGDFKISIAFGIKPKPDGLNLKYLQVKEGIYCCGDQGSPYFNKIINAPALKHDCFDGEHLIDYKGPYNYGFWFDYNKECDYEKGYAFFFHCKGKYDYTGGCVAVSEKNMIEILKKLHPNARICLYCKELKVPEKV